MVNLIIPFLRGEIKEEFRMYVCTPLFVPSNLGETKLFLTISPSFEDIPDMPFRLHPKSTMNARLSEWPTTPTTRNGPGTVKSTLLTLSSYKRPFSPMSGTCLKSGCRYWTSRGQRHEGKNRSSQQHRPHRPRANPAAHKAPDWSNFPQSLQTGL